jgi:hypothetical protein
MGTRHGPPSSIKIFTKGDEAAPVGIDCPALLVGGFIAGGGALLCRLVPNIAALPDAVAQAGERAEGGGGATHDLFLSDFDQQAHYITASSRMTIFLSNSYLMKIMASCK